MKRVYTVCVVSIFVLFIVSCSTSDSLSLSDNQVRDALQTAVLLDTDHIPESPVHNDYFLPLGESAPALADFSGTLAVAEFEMQDSIPANEPRSQSGRFFPGFEVEFFTYDDYLVPANREIMASTGSKSRWTLIFSPGKVWSESADAGYSRASFPFVMASKTSNEVHNGIATFLYDKQSVSQLFFQIVQETAAWNRNDYWGQTELAYTPGIVANETDLRNQFEQELAAQLPIRPWSDLEEMVDDRLLDAADGGLEPTDISATGVVVDGVIYMQPNVTRYGEFPYGRYMRHGVFSVTKSMAAAVTLLRLAEKYGDEVFDLKIVDYVEVTARHDGWQGVTFGNAISMATGVGDQEHDPSSSYVTADEDQNKFLQWMQRGTADEMLDGAFQYGNYKWGPGEVVRYNSINTFVLSAAMDAYLKSKEGADADLWQMVQQEVYEPIGVFHAPIMRTWERDGSVGLPIFGYGLYPTVDDTAKISMLMHNGGTHNGKQLLSPTKLAEALYQTEEQGFSINRPNEFGESRYLHSFWSVAHCTNGNHCFQIPYMVGYGGNLTLLIPNGVTVFRYADAYNYDPEPLAALGVALSP